MCSAAETGYVDVGVAETSPDDRLLAWSADTTGAEIYQLRFTDIATGQVLPDVIERSYPGGAWASDCEHFFYLVPDELNRPHQVWRHALGTLATGDELVYEESDARFELTLAASRSGELIIITAASRDTTEVRIILASRPLSPPEVVEPRRRGIEYRVDHAADPAGGTGDLLIVTDDGSPEFTPDARAGQRAWPGELERRRLPGGCAGSGRHPAAQLRRVRRAPAADAAPQRRPTAGDHRSRWAVPSARSSQR